MLVTVKKMTPFVYFAICILIGWLSAKAMRSLKQARDQQAFTAKHWTIWAGYVFGMVLVARFVGREIRYLPDTVVDIGFALIVIAFVLGLVIRRKA